MIGSLTPLELKYLKRSLNKDSFFSPPFLREFISSETLLIRSIASGSFSVFGIAGYAYNTPLSPLIRTTGRKRLLSFFTSPISLFIYPESSITRFSPYLATFLPPSSTFEGLLSFPINTGPLTSLSYMIYPTSPILLAPVSVTGNMRWFPDSSYTMKGSPIL